MVLHDGPLTRTPDAAPSPAKPSAAKPFFFEGTGEKAVLLVHGLTGAPTEMHFVGKLLNRAGFTVLAPVLAGHGLDEEALGQTKYEDWIDSLREPLAELARHSQRVYTAGICVGGVLALMVAEQMPGIVEKAAIFSPLLTYNGWNQPKWGRFAEYLAPALRYFRSWREARFEETHPFGIKDDRLRQFLLDGPFLEGTLPVFPALALYENFRLNRALWRALPRMRIPTLLIHSLEDDVSHPSNALKLKRRHGGECEIAWLNDSYHMIHIDREREKVADLAARFFGLPESGKPAEHDRKGKPVF
jgi:carboxylesterase